MAKKSTETIHLKLRLPEGLRRQIEKSAARNERSMNSEILIRLQNSFEQPGIEEIIKTTVDAVFKGIEINKQQMPAKRSLANLGDVELFKSGEDKK